ncbi:MAG: hypothetical protein M3025_07480 [Actinomycetota bacterium]|nr:hypothetical protein [Actinomycetota bacterium]
MPAGADPRTTGRSALAAGASPTLRLLDYDLAVDSLINRARGSPLS